MGTIKLHANYMNRRILGWPIIIATRQSDNSLILSPQSLMVFPF